MTAAEVHDTTERERVEAWRFDELRRAGYSEDAADAIARRADIDLHAATGLLEQGCPPEIALRILI